MKGLRERIHWQTTVGDKLTIGGAAITPQAQALVVRTPFGGWVWPLSRRLAVSSWL